MPRLCIKYMLFIWLNGIVPDKSKAPRTTTFSPPPLNVWSRRREKNFPDGHTCHFLSINRTHIFVSHTNILFFFLQIRSSLVKEKIFRYIRSLSVSQQCRWAFHIQSFLFVSNWYGWDRLMRKDLLKLAKSKSRIVNFWSYITENGISIGFRLIL